MRKFKHIKTGLVATPLESVERIYKYGEEEAMHYLIGEDMLETCDAWEEVFEKGYEILSFLNTLNNTVYISCNHERTLYNTHEDFNFAIGERKLDFCLKHYEIHSIKRLSDGEIFTIGDKVKENVSAIIGTISSIKTVDATLFFSFLEGGLGDVLENLTKLGELLFVTYDGVEIFEGDNIYYVETTEEPERCFKVLEYTVQKYPGRFTSDNSLFSFAKKENAEEYILFNKPCLSLNDLLSVWGDKDEIELYKTSPLFLTFKELAKTK